MIRELVHFFRQAPTVMKLQKQHSRAEFADLLTRRVDEQGYAPIRRQLANGLQGRILEVGCGTGAAFPYYGSDVEVEAIEPEADFREIAARTAAAHPRIHVSEGDAMQLQFADGWFDGVMVSLVLCSVPSVERALAEIHRVLRPRGQLRLLEHVRSPQRVGGFLMNAANPLWRKLNKQGCNMNRNPLPAIEAASFVVDEVEAFQRFDTWMPAFPMQRIHAHRA
jgi:SAM-dependent methyltransferase